jgi:hypothetical protein
MPLLNETLVRLKCAARILAEQAGEPMHQSDQRAAYNSRLQEHLTAVVEAHPGEELAATIENWCELFGLRYLPEPVFSKATQTIADECVTYAQRYKVSLHDAIAEWEGEDARGGFGMAPGEKAEVAGYLVNKGYNLDAVFSE